MLVKIKAEVNTIYSSQNVQKSKEIYTLKASVDYLRKTNSAVAM